MGFTFMLLPNIIFGILLSSICIYPYHCCSSGLPYYELCYFIFWMYFISKIFIICQMTDVSTRNACPWCPRWPLLPQKFYLSLANCCMWHIKAVNIQQQYHGTLEENILHLGLNSIK
jgi:hypothetical protein